MTLLARHIPGDRNKIYTVSQLNRETSRLLGEHFLTLRVEGEISNLSLPASGHWYFSLKDANAQIRCAMFKNQQRKLGFKPENGKQVIVTAEVSLYEPRGDYQLIVEAMEESGHGALQKAFDALKMKLAAEGLFDSSEKKEIPALPRAVGVITTPSGAAIRDILSVLKRRFAAIPVIIYPASVQGENAKFELVKAIMTANRDGACDTLILARGGGTLEDLWAFNEEMVARAIFASKIPIISGVGHETDVTIADFVADLRAATPTAAAEHATPDQQQWLSYFRNVEIKLGQLFLRKLRQQQQMLDLLTKRLHQQHPERKLSRDGQRLIELASRLHRSLPRLLQQRRGLVQTGSARLWRFNPIVKVKSYQQRQFYLTDRLLTLIQANLIRCRHRLESSSQTLHAVSPLATLNRGYAMVTQQDDGKIVRSVNQLAQGDCVQTKLADGSFTSRISKIEVN